MLPRCSTGKRAQSCGSTTIVPTASATSSTSTDIISSYY